MEGVLIGIVDEIEEGEVVGIPSEPTESQTPMNRIGVVRAVGAPAATPLKGRATDARSEMPER